MDEYLHPPRGRIGRSGPLARWAIARYLTAREAGRIGATRALAPLQRRKARAELARVPVRLHLGAGPVRLEGWLNVDLVGTPVDLRWDLRRPLPFPDGSVAAVFHEHLLEHLPLAAGLTFTRECARVLRPGGILRIGVPDFGRYAADYAAGGSFVEGIRPGRPTRLLALAEVFYSHGHRSVWDAETLVLLFHSAGLAGARQLNFGDSALDPCPDSPHRRDESLYVEGQKPG